MNRSARALVFGAAGSLMVHLAVALLLPSAEGPARERTGGTGQPPIDVKIETISTAERRSRVGEPASIVPGGAYGVHNIDSRERGRGGDRTGAQSVIWFLPRDDQITLSDAPLNGIGIGQAQRIRTARDGASPEDRRATPNPADDPFLASGAGIHRERRLLATVDARRGARNAPDAARRGPPVTASTAVGSREAGEVASERRDRSFDALAPVAARDVREESAAHDSPGRGILDGRGPRASEAASIAWGRPPVDQASPATFATQRDLRVRDHIDSEMRATRTVQSVVDATARRGTDAGEGRGGRPEEGFSAAGAGHPEGGGARALGPGRGSWDALDTSDPRYVRWFAQLRRAVESAIVFPRPRQLAMDQGTSLVQIVLRRDGTLVRTPRLLRTSGMADLDRAALAAIERSAPFAPVPDALAPGRSTIEIRLPVEFWNPLVR